MFFNEEVLDSSEIAEDLIDLSFVIMNLTLWGFAAALAVLVTEASQSRQHESRKSPTKSLFNLGSRRISIFTVNTKEYHSDVLAIITRIMRRT
ncbi:hypothetical protein Tco_0513553 [Tanacetum coccineum]